MNKLSILTCAFALTATTGFAATVDFEDEVPLGSDPTNVGTSYSNGIIDFSSSEDMQLVGVGAPTSGFVPDDMPVGGDFGEVFLTGDFLGDTNMTLTFGGYLIESIAFDIADIDGDEKDDRTGNDETFVFEFFKGALSLGTQTIASTDVAGDGTVVNVSFAGLFDKVTIVGTTPNGNRNIGWGIDNIEVVSAVPVPAAGLMLLAGLGGLGVMRRRKKAA